MTEDDGGRFGIIVASELWIGLFAGAGSEDGTLAPVSAGAA
jgi:hypothetical protein